MIVPMMYIKRVLEPTAVTDSHLIIKIVWTQILLVLSVVHVVHEHHQ
jgi:hypothetical protein